MSRFQSAIAFGLAWLVGLAFMACGGKEHAQVSVSDDAPDIVLIVLDTVRRDRLSAYGYERQTSSRFDALRERSRLFLNAYATSSWTPPSHASLFTGFYPLRHGTTQERWTLREEADTLAEILSEAGYETAGVSGNVMLSRAYGFDQGFETYHESWRGATSPDRDRTTVAWIKQFLSDRNPSRPLFLFVNLIGAHTPYDSCGDSCGAFGAALEDGIVDSHWQDYYRGRLTISPREFDRLNRLYDAEVKEVDVHLGRIVEAFEQHRPLDDPVIVVTSDHGENIGDHGHVNHVFSLYESTIRIPLLIRDTRHFEAGSQDPREVQLVDLFPSILHAAGLPTVSHPTQGMDLMQGQNARRAIVSEYYRPVQALEPLLADATPEERRSTERFWRRIRTMSAEGWKLHWSSDGDFELYHLADDPNEERDLIDQAAAATLKARLLERLQAFIEDTETVHDATGERSVREPVPAVDDETEAELRSLGYVD